MNCNPLLLIDFYKATHSSQYPAGLTKMVSYYTPRMSRLKDVKEITFFGLQGFLKEYLIDAFNKEFFWKDEDEVVAEYNRVLTYTLGAGSYDDQKIRDLHQLGYLPLEIRAVQEGLRTLIGCPQIEISNTHPNFCWLVNTIETMLSCYMWHIQTSAEVGRRYFDIVKKYHEMSCDDSVDPHRLLGDFSMRGQQSVESAIKSSAAWCLSFYNTATVPAIVWLERNYNCDCTKEPVGYGAISTEHSVMCSNFAVDGDEVTHIRRLLNEIYPNHSFSMVSDSYDYWNLVDNILPQVKEDILAHNGCLSIRGDSGDPVEIIAGCRYIVIPEEDFSCILEDACEAMDYYRDTAYDMNIQESCMLIAKVGDRFDRIHIDPLWSRERGGYTDSNYYFLETYNITIDEDIQPTSEEKGTVWALWDTFGGTINSKGYKVLDSHIKAIYGDSITPQRCEEIYNRLIRKGFAINNVALGVGSFSMMCLETVDEDGEAHYNPYTRDTFGIAVKTTYAEDAEGKPIAIYKQPKALSWKKSQKGCCALNYVTPDSIDYIDELTWDDHLKINDNDLFHLVFANGYLKNDTTLAEVRERMYGKK